MKRQNGYAKSDPTVQKEKYSKVEKQPHASSNHKKLKERFDVGSISSAVQYCSSCKPEKVYPGFSLYPPETKDVTHKISSSHTKSRTVLIGNLPDVITGVFCTYLFSSFGEIESLKLDNKQTGSNTVRFCVVNYKTIDSSSKLMKFNGYYLAICKPNTRLASHQLSQLQISFHTDSNNDTNLLKEKPIKEMISTKQKFSETEAKKVLEYLLVQDKFISSMKSIINWFTEGSCNVISSETFVEFSSTAMISLKYIDVLIGDFATFLKEQREKEEEQRNEVNRKCGVIEQFFGVFTRQEILELCTPSQKDQLKEYTCKAFKTLTDARKKLREDDMTLEEKIQQLKDENQKLKFKSEEHYKTSTTKILLENTKLVLKHKSLEKEIEHLNFNNEKLRVEIDELKTAKERMVDDLQKVIVEKEELQMEKIKLHKDKANELSKVQKDIESMKETISGLEKYVAHVSRERTKAKMFDDMISGKIVKKDSIGEECKILSDKDGNHTSNSTLLKKETDVEFQMPDVKISSKELVLLPTLAILLHALPRGGTTAEISGLLWDKKIRIKPMDILKVVTKFPKIFKLDSLNPSSERWYLALFDCFKV